MKKPFIKNEKDVAGEKEVPLYYCNKCDKYLKEKDFNPSAIKKRRQRCKRCNVLQATYHRKKNNYTQLLYRIKDSEREKGSRSVMLWEEEDVRTLVKKHFNKRSAMSGTKMSDEPGRTTFSLVRFWNDLPFSKENCVLLTKKEALSHTRRSHPEKLYAKEFVKEMEEIRNKKSKPGQLSECVCDCA